MEVLDEVAVGIRRCHLHGGGQVQDDRVLDCGTPFGADGVAYLERVVDLGAGERLGRVLEADRSAFVALGQFLAQSCA